MTDAPTFYNVHEPRESAIVVWRARCFEEAGLGYDDAWALAKRRDVDRADVERVLRAGASSAEARAIFE